MAVISFASVNPFSPTLRIAKSNFEIKHGDGVEEVTSGLIAELERKREILRHYVSNRFTIQSCLLTCAGVQDSDLVRQAGSRCLSAEIFTSDYAQMRVVTYI